MNQNSHSKKYVLDTNIFSNLEIYLPPNMFVRFYEIFFEAIKSKKVILLDCVYLELKKYKNGDRELRNFLKKCYVNKLIISTDHLLNRSAEINDKYSMIDEINRKSNADPIIIAFCEQDKSNNVLLTREGWRKNNQELFKIPDVCKILNITFNRNLETFYQHINYNEN